MAALVALSMLSMRSEKKPGVSALGITFFCLTKTPCKSQRPAVSQRIAGAAGTLNESYAVGPCKATTAGQPASLKSHFQAEPLNMAHCESRYHIT